MTRGGRDGAVAMRGGEVGVGRKDIVEVCLGYPVLSLKDINLIYLPS